MRIFYVKRACYSHRENHSDTAYNNILYYNIILYINDKYYINIWLVGMHARVCTSILLYTRTTYCDTHIVIITLINYYRYYIVN